MKNSINLLELLMTPFETETKESVKHVGSLRNLCYLEHGYDSVSPEAAEKALVQMGKAVTAIASKAKIEKTPLQYAEELKLKA